MKDVSMYIAQTSMTRREISLIVAGFYPKVLADIVASYCEIRPHLLREINLKESTIPRGICGLIAHKLNTIAGDTVLPFFGDNRHESLTLRVTINPSCQVIPLPDERFAVADSVGIQIYTSEGKFLYRWEIERPSPFSEKRPYRPIYLSVNTTRDTIAVAYETIYDRSRVRIFDIRGDNIHLRIDWLWDHFIVSMIFISPNELAVIDLQYHCIRIISVEGKQLRSWLHNLRCSTSSPFLPRLSLLHREGKREIAAVSENVAHLFTPEGKFLRKWSFKPTESPASIIQLSEDEFIIGDRWYHHSMDDGQHSCFYRLRENDMMCDIARITEDVIVIATESWYHSGYLINVLKLRTSEDA